jgi:hypothetical protein
VTPGLVEAGSRPTGGAVVAVHVQTLGLFVVVPIVIWSAWRFRQSGATAAALVASIVVTVAASSGTGKFGHLSLTDRMVALQVFNAVVALSALVFSAAVGERLVIYGRLSEVARVTQEAIIARPSGSMGPVSLATAYQSATDQRPWVGISTRPPSLRSVCGC